MAKWGRRMRRSERGQNLIEMALLLPVLIMITIGVIDMGRAYHHYIIITNASREGARFGSRFPHYATGIIETTIGEAIPDDGEPCRSGNVCLSPADVTITGLSGAAGMPLRVTVTYDFPTILGHIIGLPNLQLCGYTEMVIFGIS